MLPADLLVSVTIARTLSFYLPKAFFCDVVKSSEDGNLNFYCQCCPYIYAIDRQVRASFYYT